jgi:hypothetical protein
MLPLLVQVVIRVTVTVVGAMLPLLVQVVIRVVVQVVIRVAVKEGASPAVDVFLTRLTALVRIIVFVIGVMRIRPSTRTTLSLFFRRTLVVFEVTPHSNRPLIFVVISVRRRRFTGRRFTVSSPSSILSQALLDVPLHILFVVSQAKMKRLVRFSIRC